MKRVTRLLSALAFLGSVLWPAMLGAQTGTWYYALDAEPYGLPPGSNLAGLATFHRGKSFQMVDGGDLGGLPFSTRHTAQFGSWRRTETGIKAVSLFLQGDTITGEIQSWVKVHLDLHFDGPQTLVGNVNVFELPCDLPAPFPVFGCPDPIASATMFNALPPFDVPIRFRRLPAHFVSPD